jgi:hypothetical protein
MAICWLDRRPPASQQPRAYGDPATRGHDVDYRDTHEVSPAMQAARQVAGLTIGGRRWQR